MGGVLAVVDGAILKCTKGLGVSNLHATTGPTVALEHHVLATINDYQPGVNVPPFRYCKKLHKECSPVLPSPWQANLFSGVLVAPSIAGILPMTAELHCSVGGDIVIISAGQSTLLVGQAERLAQLEQELRDLYAEWRTFEATEMLPPDWDRMVGAVENIQDLLDAVDVGGQLADSLGSIGVPKKFIKVLRRGTPIIGQIHQIFEDVPLDRNQVKAVYKELLRRQIQATKDAVRQIKGTHRPRRYRLGGAYRDLPAEGGERHHMPAQSASPLSRGSGPAIRMDTQDHRATASWGPSKKAKAYRARQRRLIEQGRFHDAQQMDIDDIRTKFGSKYDDAIHEAIEYTSRWPTS